MYWKYRETGKCFDILKKPEDYIDIPQITSALKTDK